MRWTISAISVTAIGWLSLVPVCHPGEAAPAGEAVAGDLEAAIRVVCAVGREGTGHVAAAGAWQELSRADAGQLDTILAGMDGAGPLATNWLRAAVDTIAERTLNEGRELPIDRLETFLRNRDHAPRPRRLAYEWIVQVDPAARDRLLPGMLDDPGPELRRDAVARVLAAAEAATGEESKGLYQKALHAARDLDQIEASAAALAKLGQPTDLTSHLGYIVDWHLIGPFDNTGAKGFATEYPPEREIDFEAVHDGKAGPVKWFRHHTDQERAVVDLNKIFGKTKAVIAYAAVVFFSDLDQEVQLRLGSINACKVWANGQPAGAYEAYHEAMAEDQYISTVRLTPGKNLILLKVCQNEEYESWTERWEFQLRVTDTSGAGVHSSVKP